MNFNLLTKTINAGIMEKYKIILSVMLLSTAFIFYSSCRKESTYYPIYGDYLPMQVNNYWDFEHVSKISISGTNIIDNKTYFQFLSGTDTSYYRKENGKVYVRRSYETEALLYDLTAKEGDVWQYHNWNVKMVSKKDTLLVNNAKVPNCYQFFFDIPGAIDDEHSIWLAPGIGFIRMNCGECLYPTNYLVKAKINNVEISFP
jgi:hypothetical protein